MTTETTATPTPGMLTCVSGQGAHHRDIYLRHGNKQPDGSWPAVAKCCSTRVGSRATVDANARLLTAAWNSYMRHTADPLAAAEADLLGEALRVLASIERAIRDKSDVLHAANSVAPYRDDAHIDGIMLTAAECVAIAALLARAKAVRQ